MPRMIDEDRAAQIISRIQIIRTWAATPTAREDIPRINNKDCEKVVEWLDDALELLKEKGCFAEEEDCDGNLYQR